MWHFDIACWLDRQIPLTCPSHGNCLVTVTSNWISSPAVNMRGVVTSELQPSSVCGKCDVRDVLQEQQRP